MRVNFHTQANCPECDEIRSRLEKITKKYNLQVTEISGVDDGAPLPVVQVEDVRIGRLVSPITEGELDAYFHVAQLTIAGKLTGAPATLSQSSIVSPYTESVLDRIARFLGRNWLKIMVVALGAFSILPWIAPIFAALGWWALADPIYTLYAVQCHQLPERAPHIFGYEVCQCWRCSALYGGMFLLSLAFLLLRGKNNPVSARFKNPLPVWIFLLLLLPMLIDGLSHMFGVRDTFDMATPSTFGNFMVGSQVGSLNWFLRIGTGLASAIGAIWFSLPRMQRAMEEAEALRNIYLQSSLH